MKLHVSSLQNHQVVGQIKEAFRIRHFMEPIFRNLAIGDIDYNEAFIAFRILYSGSARHQAKDPETEVYCSNIKICGAVDRILDNRL